MLTYFPLSIESMVKYGDLLRLQNTLGSDIDDIEKAIIFSSKYNQIEIMRWLLNSFSQNELISFENAFYCATSQKLCRYHFIAMSV